jgi:adenylate cyclase
VRVISDRSGLPKPSGREAFVLQRVGASADPAIRLACQLRPTNDIAFIPILPPFIGADFVRRRVRANLGVERYIVSVFVDMRGSTKFAEERLPFDAIFLVNRFLEAASKAVVDAGGRQAIKAAAMISANVEHLNYQFATDLRGGVQFGIGIHGGDVILGDIGYRERTVFTALGDAVNVAARLQDMTKTLNCAIAVSEEVFRTAGISADALTQAEVTVRGRDEPITVRTATDPTVLSSLLESPAPEPEPGAPLARYA